jgi:hypothetical protein
MSSQREENCQPLCKFCRSFHSCVTTCVPKGTGISPKVGTLVTQGQPHQVGMSLLKSQVKPWSRMGLGLQTKPECINRLQSLWICDSTQLLKRTLNVQESPMGFFERERSIPRPLQTAPHSDFSEYDNIIPLVSCHSSQIQCSDNLLCTDFTFLTAVCCIIYLFRIVHILQIVVLTVVSLHCS